MFCVDTNLVAILWRGQALPDFDDMKKLLDSFADAQEIEAAMKDLW